MSPRQQAYLYVHGSDPARVSPVDARLTGEYPPADHILFKAAKLGFDLPGAPVRGVVARQRVDQILLDARKPRSAFLLLHNPVGVAHPVAGCAFH